MVFWILCDHKIRKILLFSCVVSCVVRPCGWCALNWGQWCHRFPLAHHLPSGLIITITIIITSRLVSSSPSPSSSPPIWSHHHAQTLRFPKQGCKCLFCARDTKVHIKLVDIQYSLYSWIEGCTMFRKCILRWGRDLWSDQASDLEQLFSLTHIHKVDFTWMCF